ncbi:glycine betaine ABC transporter substrate-binding protein [Cohnella lubricantis]|uniref:Osmoprotectant ABC transporter substrate-binding protein n=1 Tax=Cohnella lubricantis TaxID=2163172 RepID=A0A841T4Z1_9BACL|nr:glycine betaine ABC transporter substrate-binding protein [Cohnella lubricantis]MBB6675922.1 osmoprotectant ABC transporter substrate-binding protein [Cohnella lubricantis]MBP2117161.1 osmoprotectant transport system substrate-binding protein [Cohnella lubricantis]
MRKQLFIVAAIVLMLSVVVTACGGKNGGSAASGSIKIGTQTYTEPKILAEMYKALIEDQTDVKVDIVPDLAASPIVIQSMKAGDIQMATLYSGEIFNGYFDIEDTKDRAEVLKQAQEGFDKTYGFKWFDGLGFENTYAFTVRKEVADENGLKSVSDLKDLAGDMRIGVDTTWLERENDGYNAFTDVYGFKFAKTFPMEISLVYKAVADKEVDVVLAYTTDPGIKQYNLQTLADDKQFFPPYDASPVVRNDTLEKYPGIEDAISPLIGKIDAETMTSLNYEVDVNKRTPQEVAVEYLQKQGLLK